MVVIESTTKPFCAVRAPTPRNNSADNGGVRLRSRGLLSENRAGGVEPIVRACITRYNGQGLPVLQPCGAPFTISGHHPRVRRGPPLQLRRAQLRGGGCARSTNKRGSMYHIVPYENNNTEEANHETQSHQTLRHGVDRFAVVDPEKDNLADVLRRIGLTASRSAAASASAAPARSS